MEVSRRVLVNVVLLQKVLENCLTSKFEVRKIIRNMWSCPRKHCKMPGAMRNFRFLPPIVLHPLKLRTRMHSISFESIVYSQERSSTFKVCYLRSKHLYSVYLVPMLFHWIVAIHMFVSLLKLYCLLCICMMKYLWKDMLSAL